MNSWMFISQKCFNLLQSLGYIFKFLLSSYRLMASCQNSGESWESFIQLPPASPKGASYVTTVPQKEDIDSGTMLFTRPQTLNSAFICPYLLFFFDVQTVPF